MMPEIKILPDNIKNNSRSSSESDNLNASEVTDIEVEEGLTVLQACEQAGVEIPRF